MKKFFINLFGIEATAKNIRGNKSSGVVDHGSYPAWKAERSTNGRPEWA